METEENAWLVPDLKDGAVFETKVVIKRSIFITTVGRVRGLDGAKKFVADISAKYSDARHNPFAFNGGPAGNSGFAGCSDDGEPHGTAGQPMLQVKASSSGVSSACHLAAAKAQTAQIPAITSPAIRT